MSLGRAFVVCLFDRQMVLLDQLKQFGYWFVIHRGGVYFCLYQGPQTCGPGAKSYFVAPFVKAKLGGCADCAHLAI